MRTLLLGMILLGSVAAQQAYSGPVIDVHVHAFKVAEFGSDVGPACGDNVHMEWPGWDPQKPFFKEVFNHCAGRPIPPAKTDEALLRETLAEFDRHDIRVGLALGDPDEIEKWSAASARMIPGISFFANEDGPGVPRLRPLSELRQLVKEKKVKVFAEFGPQYRGLRPDDPVLDPYFALAEELDIPVGLHMGEGPPGGPNFPGYAKYRVALGDPLLLEPVLVKHPKLRIFVMHFGSPFVENMIAILYSYPQVYVDVAQNDWGFPRKHFHEQLRRLLDAGFGRRIMFGSDQMVWPGTIGLAIETVDSAPFLSVEQKRDIFCRNAQRFLRLPAETCAP